MVPLGAVHGLKYWYNYTSDDLINFKAEGPILNPDTKYDSHGVYSGSAFEYNGHLYYMYTGNHRDNHWQRHASQMIARLKEDGSVEKFPKPVISQQPEGYTSHFRDPKVLNMVRNIMRSLAHKIMISKVDYYFIILKI